MKQEKLSLLYTTRRYERPIAKLRITKILINAVISV
ncbi:hypothetical protein [Rosenbergiella collisarenosi]